MDTSLSEKQLNSALQCLQRVIVEKGACIDELRANNQELGAILDGLLSSRADLRVALETDGFHSLPDFSNSNRKPKADAQDLDLAELERQTELILEKGQAAIQESLLLRMKAKKVRAALSARVNGHVGIDGHAKLPQPEYDVLSKRERQVLALMVAGNSSKQIATALGISFKTAVTHRASIMSKMDVHEIASVVREAIRRGWA